MSGNLTTNGKLVGVVFAYPVCMSIGGVLVTSLCLGICHHKRYCNKRVRYVLHKELQRRVNLSSINQFFHPLCFLKPVHQILVL